MYEAYWGLTEQPYENTSDQLITQMFYHGFKRMVTDVADKNLSARIPACRQAGAKIRMHPILKISWIKEFTNV
ncbi:MAG: hypothetical protein V1674_02480 [Candidatus Omnitrophota bacterium]